tara:strand:- start:403 stop:570 length:168 start_codon:yes stop_codon:yes gene_type:complete
MKFKQWILKKDNKNNTFTKLIKNEDCFLIKQSDGIDIETIVITKKDIEQITNIIK